MVSSRFSWIGFASLTVTTACGLFGEYTTQPGAGGSGLGGSGAGGLGGAGVGAGGAASGAGGVGGAVDHCAGSQNCTECGSEENCTTLVAETSLGNRACGEPLQPGDVSSLTDLGQFSVRRVARHDDGMTPIFASTLTQNAKDTFVLRGGSIPANLTNPTWIYHSDNTAGEQTLTGYVPHFVENTGAADWVLGRATGTVFDLESPTLPTAFAAGIDVTQGTLYGYEAPHAVESRFLAGALTADTNLANDSLNVLALHTSDFGDLTAYTGHPHLSMLRFGSSGLTQAPVAVDTCDDPLWKDSAEIIPAGGAAFSHDDVAYFGTVRCNRMLITSWDGTHGASINPFEVVTAPDQATIAGVYASELSQVDPQLNQNRLVVVGTFSGTLSFDGGESVTSTSPAPNHDVFIAFFDPQTRKLQQLTHFGGAGDVRVLAVEGFSDGTRGTLFLGGWLNGDVSWDCWNSAASGTNERAFLARISFGLDDTPITPLFVKVYGTDEGDSRITSLAYFGSELWASGEVRNGTVETHPDGISGNTQITAGAVGSTFAMKLKVDGAHVP